jgi:hypothetical protein
MNDDAASLYEFKYANNVLHEIKRRDGDQLIPIEIRPDSTEFCDFMTWACERNALNNPLLPKARYICKAKPLFEYCKSHGIMLFVASLDGRTCLHTEPVLQVGLLTQPFIRYNESSAEGLVSRNITFFPLFGVAPAHLTAESVEDGSDGLLPGQIPFMVTYELREELNAQLRDEQSVVRHLSSWQVERTFVYVDISDFSQHPVGHQLVIINSLIRMANDDEYWPKASREMDSLQSAAKSDREASLCIGDGYIFVFRSASRAAFFAAYLACLIERLIAIKKLRPEFHFRMSVHTGLVYRFWDPLGDPQNPDAGRWNYIGAGITVAERVKSVIGKDKDDVVYVSAETRSKIMAERQWPGFDATFENRGRQADKHGKLRRVYEVNHTEWAGNYVQQLIPV